MSAIGWSTTANPQSAGLAAAALMENLIKVLVAKDVLTPDEASQVVQAAISDLRHSDASLARGAVDILQKDIAPEFG